MLEPTPPQSESASNSKPPLPVAAMRTATPPSIVRIAVWLGLIGVAVGGPSFWIAVDADFDPYPMLAGTFVIYALVLAFSQSAGGQRRLCNRALTLSVVTALIVRVGTLPLGWIVDLFAGVIATGIAGVTLFFESPEMATNHFPAIMIATMIQGCFGLAAFAILTLMLYPVHKRRLIKKDQSGLCIRCGYDLRATADRCPECGMGVPEGHLPKSPEQDDNSGRTTEEAAGRYE